MQKNSYLLGYLLASGLLLGGCGGGSEDNTAAVSTEYVAKTPTAVDGYEGASGDNNMSTASSIALGALQNRTIYPRADQDWIKVSLEEGKIYEFSASNLQETGDSEIYLYDENGTQLDRNDDSNIDYDSAISDYYATYSGTHYIKVIHLANPSGLLSYQLGFREFVDDDDDGYGTFFDCNDNNSTINPLAFDIGGNGIDENCDGIDAIADTTADAYEDDNTLATAKPIPTTFGSMEEPQNRFDIQSKMRTISPSGDIDFLKITVAPYSAGEIIDVGNASLKQIAHEYAYEIQDENGSIIISHVGRLWYWISNTTATEATYYLKVFANDGSSIGGYMPAYVSYGEDRDGDGYYTMDWAGNDDCNDANASIYAGATEIDDDGIDSNCNGYDNNL